ncbi:u3 small nucleolar RNA-associated protein [Anaeramoeba ignava]|uniref:U3 small nucleolar RNA-associated protein n=1 Tax=Anaeramoeba ignava TaxID=1746090 RepID=A0A9Q0LCR5_ANAIG|nr:u3 small nucleolar RNA-associated protein [Anaeramoeba ignava]
MAVEFKRIATMPKRSRKKQPTKEERYWKKFQFPVVSQLNGPVTNIHFSPVNPYDFAVASSTNVGIFSSSSNSLIRSITKFKKIPYGGSFRSDGKLIVAGDEHPVIKVFESQKNSEPLRKLTGHQGPVHFTKFLMSNTQVISGSDDKTVRVWDIPTGQSTQQFIEHQDYVRSGYESSDNPAIFATGSYDHTVKLWDIRVSDKSSNKKSSILTLQHKEPVQSVLLFKSTTMIVSSSGNEVHIWDILAGGKELTSFTNHQKAITSLSLAKSGERLLSAGIDQLVKVYSLSTFETLHTMKFVAPILSLGVSPNDSHLVVGMSNGLLSIRHRKSSDSVDLQNKNLQKKQNYQFFIHGSGLSIAKPQNKDTTLKTDNFDYKPEKPRQRLSRFDRLLKKFKYGQALDAALETKNKEIIISIIEDLVYREGLSRALSGRDDRSLEPILNFLIKNISTPVYSKILIHTTNTILDLYSRVIGESPLVDDLFDQLLLKVKNEVAIQKDLSVLLGSLELLFSANQI